MNSLPSHPSPLEEAAAEVLAEDSTIRQKGTASKPLSIWLIVASLIGLYAAATLVMEKIAYWTAKAEGTSTALGCDLNPIVGCGSVINQPQASIFGDIPNPLIGVVAWSLLLAGAVFLLSGARFVKWQWACMQLGVTFGLAMVTYLQYSSIYNLHALCPYCMVTWAVTIPTFWLVTARNLKSYAPGAGWTRAVYEFAPAWIFLHFAALTVLIFAKFGTTVFA